MVCSSKMAIPGLDGVYAIVHLVVPKATYGSTYPLVFYTPFGERGMNIRPFGFICPRGM